MNERQLLSHPEGSTNGSNVGVSWLATRMELTDLEDCARRMRVNETVDSNPEGLDEDVRDQIVAIGKGIISLVPFAGGPLAEIISAVVPMQRADRIAAYLRALTRRIDAFEAAIKHDLLSNKQKIDLIEEGGFQAARALSENRVEQIVEVSLRASPPTKQTS